MDRFAVGLFFGRFISSKNVDSGLMSGLILSVFSVPQDDPAKSRYQTSSAKSNSGGRRIVLVSLVMAHALFSKSSCQSHSLGHKVTTEALLERGHRPGSGSVPPKM